MVLNYEYGINTGNRFLDLVDHDEDPDDFIAQQTQPEEKPLKTKNETKSAASKTTKKPTTTPAVSTTNTSGSTTKTNKENVSGKSTNTDQRKQQTNVLSNNNNQQARGDSARGGGRGFGRRGGSAGHDRPPYEGGNRGGGGGGQQRTQRFNKFEGPQTSNEPSGFEQSGDAWGNEPGNDNQSGGGYRGRGRGRGRGNYEGSRGAGGGRGRGNYEGGRGNYEGGRGRGRGGRGNYNNRSFEEAPQQQQQPPQEQQTQESSEWQQSAESNFDNSGSQSARTGGQELDTDVSTQERPFEPGSRRGGRGQFRSRTFHNNRQYGGSDRSNQNEGNQEDNRQNRRQHDRQPRSNLSGVKAVEKKDGEGAHNWGSPTENPEDNPVLDETNDAAGQGPSGQKGGWAQQVDEAEKQMTLDEYKKQIEAKKRAQQEKLPQFNRRAPGEGEDPKAWQTFQQEYRKKQGNEGAEGEELEEGSGSEVNESGDENEEEQTTGKKKVITIPLRFKPIEIPRGGPGGSRGGPRRGGGGGRPRDQPRPKSPNQQQSSYYQQTGEYQNDDQQQQQQQQQSSRPYRGGPGRGSGRGEYRRSYGNSARAPRGGYNRSNTNPNTPDFDNTVDFPTLPKQ